LFNGSFIYIGERRDESKPVIIIIIMSINYWVGLGRAVTGGARSPGPGVPETFPDGNDCVLGGGGVTGVVSRGWKRGLQPGVPQT